MPFLCQELNSVICMADCFVSQYQGILMRECRGEYVPHSYALSGLNDKTISCSKIV